MTADMRRPPSRYSIVVVLLVSISLTVASLLISLHVNRTSERKLCSVVSAQVSAYQEDPPVTPAGVTLSRNMSELQAALSCPPAIKTPSEEP